MTIPDIFCWSKMGPEAGQHLPDILRRKELERQAGGGVFTWGIGTSLGESVRQAQNIAKDGEVDALFTAMLAKPRAIDLAPTSTFIWMFARRPDGTSRALPEHMLVTSRGYSGKRSHYALLCSSDFPLAEQVHAGFVDSGAVRNLASGNPVGSSQVTSIVRYDSSIGPGPRRYPIAFRAKLHGEGFLRLVSPVALTEDLCRLLEEAHRETTVDGWMRGIREVKRRALAGSASDVS